jgi:hypothetical protein
MYPDAVIIFGDNGIAGMLSSKTKPNAQEVTRTDSLSASQVCVESIVIFLHRSSIGKV